MERVRRLYEWTRQQALSSANRRGQFHRHGAFTFVGSYVLYRITGAIIPQRVTEAQEELGLDLSQHGEFVAPIEPPENPVARLRQPA